MNFDWSNITTLAYSELIKLNVCSLPINPFDIKFDNIKIVSYQKYSYLSKQPLPNLNCNGELPDAYVVTNIGQKNINLILYNEDSLEARKEHSILHEVGHIRCKHKEHSDKNEIEAHYFAAQINAPNVLINEIQKRGYPVNLDLLIETFHLSKEAAQKKVKHFSEYTNSFPNDLDDIILQMFYPFLDSAFPRTQEQWMNDYENDMDNIRSDWF